MCDCQQIRKELGNYGKAPHTAAHAHVCVFTSEWYVYFNVTSHRKALEYIARKIVYKQALVCWRKFSQSKEHFNASVREAIWLKTWRWKCFRSKQTHFRARDSSFCSCYLSHHRFCNLTLLENRVLVHLNVAFVRITTLTISTMHFNPFADGVTYVEQYSCIFEITNSTKFHYKDI